VDLHGCKSSSHLLSNKRGKGARRHSPLFARVSWGCLKGATCFLITPLPSYAAFSVGYIFKQGRPGVTKVHLSLSLPLVKPNRLAY